MRGLVKIELNQYSHILEDFDKSISLDSTDVNVYYWRGMARRALSMTKESCEDFYKAAEMNDRYALDRLCDDCKKLCKEFNKKKKG